MNGEVERAKDKGSNANRAPAPHVSLMVLAGALRRLPHVRALIQPGKLKQLLYFATGHLHRLGTVCSHHH